MTGVPCAATAGAALECGAAPAVGRDTADGALCLSAAVVLEPEPGEWMMYMPAGTHEVWATRRGKPAHVTIEVDAQAAQVLNEGLRAMSATLTQRPFLDFDHEGKAASAWPLEFAWRDSGVWVRVEWSKAGAEAVTGKAYRAFSPRFWTDEAKPVERVVPHHGHNRPLNMGGLVNDPAFETIHPLFARAAQDVPPTPSKDPMTPEEKAALEAKIQQLERENAELKAKASSSEQADAIEAKAAEITALQAKLQAAEQAIQAARKRDAEAAVKLAVQRGAIPAQDDALQARWVKLVTDDPAHAELLAKLPGQPALEAGRIVRSGVAITRPDTKNVLEAYQAAKTPADRGAIYLREIKPIFDRREEFPLEAANSLGTLVGNLVSQRALDLVQESYPWLRGITTDFSDQSVAYNQSVVTRTLTPPAVGTYHVDNGYVSGDATGTDVTITINAHKFAQVEFNANEMAGTNRSLIQENAEALQYSLGKDLADAIGALILTANFANKTTKALADFDRTGVVDMITALNNRKTPPMRRVVVLNANYHGALLKDAGIVSLALAQSWASATGGRVPDIAGAPVYPWADLPANAQNLTGFACSPDALAVAVRLPNDYTLGAAGVPQTAAIQTVTNPHTGLSVMLVQFADHLKGKSYSRVAWMYGVAKGQATSLQRLVSA